MDVNSFVSSSGGTNAPVQQSNANQVQLRPTEDKRGSKTVPVQQSSVDPVQLRPTEDTEIPLDDLNEIFGAPSFANA